MKDLAVDMTDLKALLDKYRDDDDQNTAASESLMNGSVNADDSFSEDGLVNGHTSDVNSLTPGGPESFTGKVIESVVMHRHKNESAFVSSVDRTNEQCYVPVDPHASIDCCAEGLPGTSIFTAGQAASSAVANAAENFSGQGIALHSQRGPAHIYQQ